MYLAFDTRKSGTPLSGYKEATPPPPLQTLIGS